MCRSVSANADAGALRSSAASTSALPRSRRRRAGSRRRRFRREAIMRECGRATAAAEVGISDIDHDCLASLARDCVSASRRARRIRRRGESGRAARAFEPSRSALSIRMTMIAGDNEDKSSPALRHARERSSRSCTVGAARPRTVVTSIENMVRASRRVARPMPPARTLRAVLSFPTFGSAGLRRCRRSSNPPS